MKQRSRQDGEGQGGSSKDADPFQLFVRDGQGRFHSKRSPVQGLSIKREWIGHWRTDEHCEGDTLKADARGAQIMRPNMSTSRFS